MRTVRRRFIRAFGRTIVVAAVALGFATGTFTLVSRIFAIRSIEVTGGDITVAIDETKIPKNLLFFPSERFRKDLLLSYPQLSDIRFIKKYPNTLHIQLELREPVARLTTGGQQVLVDKEGRVIFREETVTFMPVIAIDVGNVQIGQTVQDPRIAQTITFLEHVEGMIRVELVTNDIGGELRAKGEQMEIIFTQDADVVTVATTLQTLLAGFRIKGTLPKVIDLRFDKPIVTF